MIHETNDIPDTPSAALLFAVLRICLGISDGSDAFTQSAFLRAGSHGAAGLSRRDRGAAFAGSVLSVEAAAAGFAVAVDRSTAGCSMEWRCLHLAGSDGMLSMKIFCEHLGYFEFCSCNFG